MSNIQHDRLELELAPSWYPLPAVGESIEPAVDELIAGFEPLDEEPRRQLRGGLDAVIRLSHSLAPGARTSYALVLAPASGRVQALLSIRLSRITADAYANYLAAARAYAGDARIEVVNRVVEEVTLPAGRGVLSRDFTMQIEREGVPDPALERCFLAVFPDGYETAVELTLLTQNLALFDDAGSYLMALASGERPVISGAEEAS